MLGKDLNQNPDGKNDDNMKAVYGQLCESYRAIDNFREKLLGILPLASGTGIFLLIRETGKPMDFSLLFPVGLFGFVVTLGLFVFEILRDKKMRGANQHRERLEEKPRA